MRFLYTSLIEAEASLLAFKDGYAEYFCAFFFAEIRNIREANLKILSVP